QLAHLGLQAELLLKLVEEAQRQAPDLRTVLALLAHVTREAHDAAAASVAEALRLLDALPVPRDEIEEHAFSQGPGAADHLLGAEAAQHMVGENRAGDDELDAFLVEAGDAASLVALRLAEQAAYAADLFGG